jgi:DNA-binding NtrC family response regulator
MPKGRILVADDDSQIRMLLRDRLEASGYPIRVAEDGLQALEFARSDDFDAILLDLQMPGMHGLEVLRHLQAERPEITVIVLTAFGTVEHAVEAMKLGAYDFLPKPCNPEHVLLTVRKALERKGLREENRYLKQELRSRYDMVVGQGRQMHEIMDLVARVAESTTTVLIGGESGTGKQLLARAIHEQSDRRSRPFVHVNCTTLSEQLMESDMFGHEKGAFTGAVKQKRGRFELADGGTLFLDEIGELSPSIQAKLLHAIEYGEFQRVGGVDTRRADVRVIAATNRDLPTEVKENRFREDLYYRLNVVAITLPPLRDRPEDVVTLAEHFVQKHAQAMQKKVVRISPGAIERLKGYPWPGNIRELENVIQRGVVLATGDELTPDLIPVLEAHASTEEIGIGTPLDEATRAFKRRFIARSLRHTGHNQTKAAELLQIQRTYLNRLIKELGIKP